MAQRVRLAAVTEKSAEILRTLNSAIFPVTYQDKFYQQVTTTCAGYAFIAYFDDIVVGTVCCRLERFSEARPEAVKLYIMTLGVLAPYRRLQVGSIMLNKILDVASQDSNIEEIHLHVQTNNDEALAFYKKFGFDVVEEVKDYYKRITPPHAFLLSKKMAKGHR